MKRYLQLIQRMFPIVLSAFSLSAAAQLNEPLSTDFDSPLQSEYATTALQPERNTRLSYLANPALMHQSIEEKRYFYIDNPNIELPAEGHVFIGIEGHTGRKRGDYLPYEGYAFRSLSVKANGYARSASTTFFGNAAFTSGKDKGQGWSTARYTDLYWPYIVADSTGGNPQYEKYNLMGAYAFQIGKWDLGVSGTYKGDFAFRQNDPRVENTTTWLTLKGGAAYHFYGHLLSANAEYLLHRQHIDLKHFRSGQFTKNFTEYGFGMYDYLFSPIFNYIKQRQHIDGYALNLAFLSRPEAALRMHAQAGYRCEVMTTEANIYDLYKLNLYRGLTHSTTLHYTLLWNNRSWGVIFNTNLNYHNRNGREYLFERYVSAVVDGVDIYNYKKIGHQDRYTLNTLQGDAQVKIALYPTPHSTVSLLGALSYFNRDERYKEPRLRISNTLVTPSAGLELAYADAKCELRLSGTWAHRSSLHPIYRVSLDMSAHTEFQHAFTTYANYAYKADIYTTELTAVCRYNFGKVGLKVCWLGMKGHRLSGVSYDANRLKAASPPATKHAISLLPDVHNAYWLSVSLFTIF